MTALNKSLLGLGSLVVAAAGAFDCTNSNSERADSPSKITRPLTGEVTGLDECPNIDPSRPDCPGRTECLETGELVCVDRYPTSASKRSDTLSCCSTRE